MDRETKSALLKKIEEQQEHIAKYQNKLRDLVSAYKGLQKEKEALEASVKALSAAQVTSNESRDAGNSRDAAAETGGQTADGPDANTSSTDGRVGEAENSQQTQQLRDQLATLTNSLSTLAQEKSKMLATYQAEKKQLKQEHEEIIKQFTERQETLEQNVKDLEGQLLEGRHKVRSQQHEREKEQDDHAVMLRELQKVLADERNTKEHLEQQLYDTRQSLIEAKSIPDPSKHYEKRLAEQNAELDKLKRMLRASEERANEPSPLLVQLQKELADLKSQHRANLSLEQQRTKDAEEQLGVSNLHSEERISSLESKLSELSQVTGDYERLRYQDQDALQKLRQRVTQLDLENAALAEAVQRSASTGGTTVHVGDDADVQAVVAGIKQLNEALVAANERAEKPLTSEELQALLQELSQSAGDGDLHKRCQDEYLVLKEEFERYKLRAQSVLKSKATKEVPNKEMESLKSQVGELKDRLRHLRLELDEKEADHHKKENNLRKAMEAQHERHRQDLLAQEMEQKQKLSELEQEIRRHRDRTITLLGEKDRELQVLRAHSPERLESHYYSTMRQASREDEIGADGASSEDTSVIKELLSRTSLGGGNPGEASLLHFAQEQARKDVEINNLRRQKHSVEVALRELQHNFSLKEENFTDEIDFLKEEVRKFERNRSRESANLEYLKNVTYRYLITSSAKDKHQMLNAISTILEFSPAEKKVVNTATMSAWWGSP